MKACLFDIDGTLVKTGRAGMHAFAATFAQQFGIERISKDVSFAGRSDRGITGDLFVHHGIENSQANWDRFQSAYISNLTEQLEIREGTVLPGVVALIDQLEVMGDVHIGLLTGNVHAGAQEKLGYYGIFDRFAFGGFGDHHPMRNDIATAARDAARGHHVAKSRELTSIDQIESEKIMVIGDTPNDIECARSIGAMAVAVATGMSPANDLEAVSPDLLLPTLESHDEILNWFAA